MVPKHRKFLTYLNGHPDQVHIQRSLISRNVIRRNFIQVRRTICILNYSQLGTRRASGELTAIFIEFSFGHGTRSIKEEYGIPGPGAYKHSEEVSHGSLNQCQFLPPRYVTKNTTYKYSPPTQIMQSNPHAYNVKDVQRGPKYSFGSKSGNMPNARRSLPAHLKRLLSSTPGPGDYE